MTQNKQKRSILTLRCLNLKIVINQLYSLSNVEQSHSVNVTRLSRQIARAMNLSEYEIARIGIAGCCHDIGKVFVSPRIINKTGKLTKDEWNEMKKHSFWGFKILNEIDGYSDIAQYALEHHERWDGSGYPNGLVAEEISLPARIVAIADSFDAMMSKRSYKDPYSLERTLDEIRINAGKQFDPHIAEIFIDMMSSYPAMESVAPI